MSAKHDDLVDSKHPIHTVIHSDVKAGISACIEAGAYVSAAKLIYAGIELMAYLCMKKRGGKDPHRVHKSDYVRWVRKYMIFDDFLGIEAEQIHEARHAAVHRHSLENKPGSRHLAMLYGPTEMAFPIPPRMAGVDCVVISVQKFADIFFRAIDLCLIDVHQDEQKLHLMEERFDNVAQLHPMSYEELEKLLEALMACYKPK